MTVNDLLTPDEAPVVNPHETPANLVVATPADNPDGPKGNREARYRTERNDARTELATVMARVDAFQLREVERLAGAHLSVPADLLTLAGVTVSELLDDDGDVDPEKVIAAATELVATRPGLKPRTLATDPTQGGTGNPGKVAASWGSLLKD